MDCPAALWRGSSLLSGHFLAQFIRQVQEQEKFSKLLDKVSEYMRYDVMD